MSDVGAADVSARDSAHVSRLLVAVMAVCAAAGTVGLLALPVQAAGDGGAWTGSALLAAGLIALQTAPCIIVLVDALRSHPLLPKGVIVTWAVLGMLPVVLEVPLALTHSLPERAAILLVVANLCVVVLALHSPNKRIEQNA